jgi:hypothetical protein
VIKPPFVTLKGAAELLECGVEDIKAYLNFGKLRYAIPIAPSDEPYGAAGATVHANLFVVSKLPDPSLDFDQIKYLKGDSTVLHSRRMLFEEAPEPIKEIVDRLFVKHHELTCYEQDPATGEVQAHFLYLKEGSLVSPWELIDPHDEAENSPPEYSLSVISIGKLDPEGYLSPAWLSRDDLLALGGKEAPVEVAKRIRTRADFHFVKTPRMSAFMVVIQEMGNRYLDELGQEPSAEQLIQYMCRKNPSQFRKVGKNEFQVEDRVISIKSFKRSFNNYRSTIESILGH